jgi:cytochrome c-type biogenesis protein CcmH/NrfF
VIESSNAEFSFEMRKLISRKILEGRGDEEIRAELVQEFGEDVFVVVVAVGVC